MRVTTQAGFEQTRFYPVAQWDKLQVDALPFPRTDRDVLTVRLKIWDTQKDGTPRAYAALSGSTRLKADEVATHGPTTILVRFSLKVSVKEYD